MKSDNSHTDDTDFQAGFDESAGVDPVEMAAEDNRVEVPQDGDSSSREVDELRDRYLRLAAEFDNYRKRSDRERSGVRDRAQGEIVEALLEPLDDLQRVADFEAESTTVEALLEGVQMVERKMLRALNGMGLEALDAKGKPFDPSLHEALMTAPTDNEDEDDTVGEVLQSGYQFRGNLIRPARVQVRKHGG